MVISKKNIFEIEWQFKRYHQLKEIIEEGKMDIIQSSSNNVYSMGSRSGTTSDDTGNKAIQLCKLTNEDKWLKTIENTIKFFRGTGIEKFIKKRYFENQRKDDVMLELHIETTTFYRWREEVIIYACMIAIQEGLIKI